jgi:hypothetical protein
MGKGQTKKHKLSVWEKKSAKFVRYQGEWVVNLVPSLIVINKLFYSICLCEYK